MKNTKVLGNTILYAIKTISSMLIPLITFPYVSRVLSPEGIGKYNFSNSVMTYFISLAGLGVSAYAIREGSRIRDKRQEFNDFANEVYSINVISTIVSLSVLALLIFVVPQFKEYRIILFILAFSVPLATIGVEWIFNIYEDYLYITIRSIGSQLLSVVLLFCLVHNENDLIIYCSIVTLSTSGARVLNFVRARNILKLRFVVNSNLKKHIKPILILFFSAVATQLCINADSIMLGFMKSDYEVGIYAASTKIYSIIRAVLISFVTVITPSLSNLFGNNISMYYKKVNSYLKSFILFIFPVAVGLICVGGDLIFLLCGNEYMGSVSSLQFLAVALFISVLGSFIANTVLIIARREKIILFATCVGGAVNVLFNVLLIPRFSYVGAAIATLISELFILLIQAIVCNQIVKLKIFDKDMFKVAFAAGGIVIVCFGVYALIDGLGFRLVGSIGCSVCVYYFILVLLKHSAIREVNVLVRGKIDRFLRKQ